MVHLRFRWKWYSCITPSPLCISICAMTKIRKLNFLNLHLRNRQLVSRHGKILDTSLDHWMMQFKSFYWLSHYDTHKQFLQLENTPGSIFACGHFMFAGGYGFSKAKLEESCELWGTYYVQRQMIWHILSETEPIVFIQGTIKRMNPPYRSSNHGNPS